MNPYHLLTERGQARRLRSLAWHALERYDLPVVRLSLITNSQNGVFRLDLPGGQKFVMRITMPESGHILDHVTAEMDWLAALARDTHLSVPRPVPARDGALVVEAGADGVPEPRLCAVFGWVPGTDFARHISTRNLARLGELMAKLHTHTQTYQPPTGLSLMHFDRVFPFPEPIVLFEDAHADYFPPARLALYQQAVSRAQNAIDHLVSCGEPMRILHGDLHQWNVRYHRGVLSPIDFEDLVWGWPVQDIATCLYYFIDSPDYAALRSAFQAGYTRHSPWPERYPGEIDAFIAARGIGLVNYVLNNPSPIWKRQAGEFVERIEKRLLRLFQSDQRGT
jgi:Ser/Thr protein kinase RdoA (MazF antagonist)